MLKRVIGLLLVLTLAACSDANVSNPDGEVAQAQTCSYPPAGDPAKPVDAPSTNDVANQGIVGAVLNLNGEELAMELDRGSAPCTVNSFLSLAEQGWFDGTACHRLVDFGIFILQCGDPTGTGTGGPGYTVPDEINEDLLMPYDGDDEQMIYPAGSVVMANRGQPNTGGSQFFLVYADSPLPPTYTVFGKIDEAGINVVAQIGAQGVDAADGTTPIAPAEINSIALG